MRIVPQSDAAPASPDLERIEALEKISGAILQTLRDIDERIKTLELSEKMPPPAPPYPASIGTPCEVSLDPEALRKGLLAKMWKYMHDEPARRAV